MGNAEQNQQMVAEYIGKRLNGRKAVYAGTKFAVVGLSSGLADEFAAQGVEVSCVMPTFTNTELITGTHTSAAQKPVEPEDM